jgi:hypothetical protein
MVGGLLHAAAMHEAVDGLRTVWTAVLAALPEAAEGCLFRSTEGYNVETVRRHGTDRFGRDQAMHWSERGYRGAPRRFAEVIFASTAAEVEASLCGARDRSALLKVPETPAAHLLVYRADAFERVHDDQYAFCEADHRAALVAIFALDPVRRVDG